MPRKSRNRVRIIGGAWRSRLLHFPDVPELRPTPDRVRETLFNWLGQDLHGKRCLDLFAGAGTLGFEAASRGASEVVMVERSRILYAVLRTNAARLGGQGLRMVHGDALNFLAAPDHGSFDVVFVDPPYGSGLVPAVLPRLTGALSRGGVVYIETDFALQLAPPWRARRRGTAGVVHYILAERGEDD